MKCGENGKKVFLKIADKHAPRRTIRVRNKPSPCITSEIKQQMLFRDKLKKGHKIKHSGTLEDIYNFQK